MRHGNLILFLFVISLQLHAQSARLKPGLNAFRDGNFPGAIEAMDAIIQSNAEPSIKAEAHFHRAESYWELRNLMGASGAFKDAFAKAGEDYLMALALNPAALNQRINSKKVALYPLLIQDGIERLERARKTENPVAKSAEMDAASRYFELAARLQPGQYLTADLLGQLAMEKGVYRQAEQLLSEAVRLFEVETPPTPDLLIAYAYYRLALLHRHYLHKNNSAPPAASLQNALAFLHKASAVLENEYRRARQMAGQLKSSDLAIYQNQYQQVQQDFYFLELDLLLQLPEFQEEAMRRTKDALRKEPRNYTLLLAYAQLLEQKNVREALAVYQEAITVQTDACEAHYHVGLILVNEAAKMEKEALKSPNLDYYQKFLAHSRDELSRAYPHLSIAHQCFPDNREILHALLQVTLNLHMPNDYERYKKQQEALISR